VIGGHHLSPDLFNPAAAVGPYRQPATTTPAGRPAVAQESDIPAYLASVDTLLQRAVSDLTELWEGLPDDDSQAVDVLGDCDLPQLIQGMLDGGGKRLRPVMAYLGWLSGGGDTRGIGSHDVVVAGGALEMLHLFALVHDDVMDESATRRGRPTVHLQAEILHTQHAVSGDPRRFGESIAVLVGDLAHAEASSLVAELPLSMRQIWRILVAELVAGQRRDLVGSAAGRRDLAFAQSVARMKSGRYTVERPLELGAAAAAASPAATAALGRYGRSVGEAFALRDDLLGVWGDPVRTGKPAGDDLISGKPTAILALASEYPLSPAARAAWSRAGTKDFGRFDLSVLQQELESSGVVSAVEQMISNHVQDALSALEDRALDPAGAAALARMANQIAWREK